MGDFVLLTDSRLININGAVLLDAVGSDLDTYRVYKTVSGEKVLWRSKKKEWVPFDNPDPAIVDKMNSMRPQSDPRSPLFKRSSLRNEGLI